MCLKEGLERPILREGVSRQARPLGGLEHLDLDGGSIGSGHFRWSQHGVLGKDLAINLGDQEVLTGLILPPHLPKLNGFHGHETIPLA